MTAQQLAALALAVVLVCWVLGAHNRLVMLRNAIAQVWSRVDDAARQRASAAAPLLAALREPLAAEHGALDALQATLAESARTAAAMTTRPVDGANASAWLAAESALAAAASRVFALLDQHAALRDAAAVASGAAGWRDADARLRFARQLFNDAAETYDAAIAQFPTHLLLRPFGYARAGRI